MLENLEKLLANKIEKQKIHDENLRVDTSTFSISERVAHDIATRKTFNDSLAADLAYAEEIKRAALEEK